MDYSGKNILHNKIFREEGYMRYFIKDGSKSNKVVIVLKWIYTIIMLECTIRVISKTFLGAMLYFLSGVLMNPILVKNQKHKLWVIIVSVLLYLAAPRVVCLITKGTFF